MPDLPIAFKRPGLSRLKPSLSHSPVKLVWLLFWCWLPIFLLLSFAFLTFVIHGEPVDLSRSPTWVAFFATIATAMIYSLPPALLVALLVAAARLARDFRKAI